mmetsp:Transcript_23932/g.49896  ORF Transcript_23932/g.49896 Transcript_23932/m.49896 type:complete len:216 (+) Transcript_23932:460-1107(+)
MDPLFDLLPLLRSVLLRILRGALDSDVKKDDVSFISFVISMPTSPAYSLCSLRRTVALSSFGTACTITFPFSVSSRIMSEILMSSSATSPTLNFLKELLKSTLALSLMRVIAELLTSGHTVPRSSLRVRNRVKGAQVERIGCLMRSEKYVVKSSALFIAKASVWTVLPSSSALMLCLSGLGGSTQPLQAAWIRDWRATTSRKRRMTNELLFTTTL